MPNRLLATVDSKLWIRLLALLLAGGGLVMLAHWTVQMVAPTTETPAVVTSVDPVGKSCGRRGGHCETVFQTQVVTESGSMVDLPKRLTLTPGRVIRIVRSDVAGQIVAVRYPDGLTDLRTDSNGMIELVGGVLLFGAGLVGFRGWRHSPVAVTTVFTAGALVAGLVLFTPPSSSPAPAEAAPDAMQGYSDPPTTPSTDPDQSAARVTSVVGPGVQVTSRFASNLTVTGPALAGPPPGTDPAAASRFDLVSVPVRATPGPDSGVYGAGTDSLPNVALLGGGVGDAVRLTDGRSCGGAPELFPSQFQAPRDGYLCFAVAPGFTPRYLVLINDDVAVDLRGGGGDR